MRNGATGVVKSFCIQSHVQQKGKLVDLGLVKFMNSVHTGVKSVNELMAKYTDRFSGIEKMKDVRVKLHIDLSVKPFQQNTRYVPFHLRQLVEEELNGLEELDII